LLAEYFAQKTCERLGIPYKGFAIDALNFLRGLPWQGNVRELRNLIETIIQLEKTGFLSLDIVKKYIPPALPPHIVVEQPKETSLLRIETAKEAQIGLEIVLRTLFELKKDVDLVKDALNELNSKIDSLNSNVMELKPNSYQIVDASDSLSFDKDNLNLEEIEKNLISFALKKFKGNRRLTAKALGISERTLYRKINQYNLD
jgi:DNA-binding NtrC family response regulator